MLTVVMAENSPDDAQIIRDHLNRFLADQHEEGHLVHYPDGEAVALGLAGDADLVLLDIDMPRLNGLDAARRLRERGVDAPLCFMTNYGSLAPEGYAVEAMGFLVKPVSYRAFASIMERARVASAHRRPRLTEFKQGKQTIFVDAGEILYVETERKHVVIHTKRGAISCSEAMKAIEGKLDRHSFFRIHNAYLVNLTFVQTITPTDVVVGGASLPVSRHRRRHFLDTLAHYMGSAL